MRKISAVVSVVYAATFVACLGAPSDFEASETTSTVSQAIGEGIGGAPTTIRLSPIVVAPAAASATDPERPKSITELVADKLELVRDRARPFIIAQTVSWRTRTLKEFVNLVGVGESAEPSTPSNIAIAMQADLDRRDQAHAQLWKVLDTRIYEHDIERLSRFSAAILRLCLDDEDSLAAAEGRLSSLIARLREPPSSQPPLADLGDDPAFWGEFGLPPRGDGAVAPLPDCLVDLLGVEDFLSSVPGPQLDSDELFRRFDRTLEQDERAAKRPCMMTLEPAILAPLARIPLNAAVTTAAAAVNPSLHLPTQERQVVRAKDQLRMLVERGRPFARAQSSRAGWRRKIVDQFSSISAASLRIAQSVGRDQAAFLINAELRSRSLFADLSDEAMYRRRLDYGTKYAQMPFLSSEDEDLLASEGTINDVIRWLAGEITLADLQLRSRAGGK